MHATEAPANPHAARAAECERRGRQTHIRFGSPLAEGDDALILSYNHRDGRLEDGLSVYAAWAMPDGTYILDMRGVDMLSLLFGGFTSRPAWEVWGEVIGTGSDGEPIIDIDGAECEKIGVIELGYVI
jgi:hypothetical protein